MDVRKPENHGYDVIVYGELFGLTTWSPSQTCHAKPKTQINRRRTLPASFPLVDAYRKQLYRKILSEKVRTLWHCSRLRSVALYLWLIVVISVRQSTVAQYLFHCRALVICPEHKAGQPDCKIQRSGGTVREIDVWAESPRLSPLWLSASSFACHGLLIITVITPLPTKPSATKCQRTEAGERGNYWHADASAWCCCARCKIHEGVSWCCWKWCSQWWCCRWSSSVALSKQFVSQCVKPPRLRGDAALPDWQTLLNVIIYPERGRSLCKNNWKEPEVY